MNTNQSNNFNSACVFSQTKTKEISSALFPITSTGFNTPYQSREEIKCNYQSLVLQSRTSPHEFTFDSSHLSSKVSVDRFEEFDSQRDPQTTAKNDSVLELYKEAFDNTSCRDEWIDEVLTSGAVNGDVDHLIEISTSEIYHDSNDRLIFDCLTHLDSVVTISLAVISLCSPVLMVLLPKLAFFRWPSIVCDTACESTLMIIAFKLCILVIATVVLYCRRRTYSFPRVVVLKVLLVMFLSFVVFTFWLFYVLRILMINGKKVNYDNIVSFSSSVTDLLLFMHYLAIVLLEIRHLDTSFCIKITRSPDGESRFYKVGNLSIQAAAVKILQNYLLDFPLQMIYPQSTNKTHSGNKNRTLPSSTMEASDKDQHSPIKRSASSMNQSSGDSRRDRFPKSLRQSDFGFSVFKERLYKEVEHEKRLKKRRLQLLASGEDIFSRITKQCVHEEYGREYSAKLLSSSETAQNILIQLAKPFRKYLKLSKLQLHFPRMRILNQLVKSLQFGMSAQAFLTNFITTPKMIESSECIHGQVWTVVSNKSLCRGLSNKMTFLLKRQNVSLLCSVYHFPMFSLTEDLCDINSQTFVIKMNSETSV